MTHIEIAAAPDLLATLREALAYLSSDDVRTTLIEYGPLGAEEDRARMAGQLRRAIDRTTKG